MRGIVAVVFVCVCAVCFLFSPERFASAEDFARGDIPSVFVGEVMSDEEELQDSSPLFLPTRWNAFESNLGAVLSVQNDLEIGFKGVLFSDEKEEVLKPQTDSASEKRDVFDVVNRWELTRTFGERRSSKQAAPISGVRMEVVDCAKNQRIFLGSVDFSRFYDDRRLLRVVEVECYGDVEFRRFIVNSSSGNRDVDKSVEEFVRMWSAKHLRESGRYRFRLGR